MLKITQGDMIEMALNGQFDMIIHGCNCFHTQGAGLAKQISSMFPAAYAADKKSHKGSLLKLGNYTRAEVDNNMGGKFIIVNAYTQYMPGPHAEYSAINQFFAKLYSDLCNNREDNLRIGIPEIGCGIGGLNIENVKRLIEFHLGHLDVTLVKFEKTYILY